MKVKRIIAFLIDYIILLFPIYTLLFSMEIIFNCDIIFCHFYLIISIIMFLLSLKDLIFKNASIGKKIMGLRIVDNKNNSIPNMYKIIIRNLTLILWPIDIIGFLFSNKRIGELMTNTKVESFM